MSMSDALERALLAGSARRNTLRLVRVRIATVGPLTVTLPDGTTVPGLPISGLTYTVGGYGTAFLAEGVVPPVLPTA